MKALTLWQPYASLIAFGAKRIETRSWATSYRGELAIHAAKKSLGPTGDMRFEEALARSLPDMEFWPEGVIVATCQLVECRRLPGDSDPTPSWLAELEGTNEMLFGDYGPNRFAWILKDIKKLDNPIPATGKQGLWEWEVSR